MLHSILYKNFKGGIFMIEKIAKIAEKCAQKSAGNICWPVGLHQPKMPKSLVKKD